MKRSFSDLGISPPILKALKEMGFKKTTEVQSKAIPHGLKGRDLIVRSKTGTGKTAVFGVTMLQLIDPRANQPQGLILTPTRELAVQVDSDLKLMSSHLGHKTTAIYGQHSLNTEIKALEEGVAIVTGTPGRVYDHICQGNLITKNIRFLVLDEADRMLDMGFLDQVVKIIKKLPRDRATLLFSATIPYEVRKLCRNFMNDPVSIEIESATSTVETTEQFYYRVDYNEKNTQLNRILLMERPESCMIFCNTRARVDQVQKYLARKGYACMALHGDISQSQRMKTINSFKRGLFPLLVATDVAARGIHVDDLSLVINYDIPNEKDGYIHRIGRTGRAGQSGRAISLVTSDDIISLYEIEEHIGVMIPEAQLPTEADLRENREEAEKWKQAHRQIFKSSRQTAEKGTAVRKKGSASRKRRSRQSNRNHPHAAESVSHKRQPLQNAGKYRPPQEPKPAKSADLPRAERSPAVDHTAEKPAVKAVKVQEPAQKATVLQRWLQRLFGRPGGK
ncbi:MAG: DEAD/DEAH box helicase [Syntrophomonadaceae bacterium]|jgi:ATP-dependent RNA helicase DeaD|nr:DEAD/DEAH box helicase [Syntrophomonadaceae bacterium]